MIISGVPPGPGKHEAVTLRGQSQGNKCLKYKQRAKLGRCSGLKPGSLAISGKGSVVPYLLGTGV